GAFDVIEHLDDDVEALAHMRSAVKPGGGVILTVPQHRWLWSAVDDFSRHRRRYDRRGLTALLTRAGFRLVWATSFMALLLPLLMLSRLRPRDQASFDPTAELRIGDLANRTLGIVCAVERRLIHAGVRLPAGGSLIAVARRS
ncbi:MAG: methyltransferase domain-containing protein, partial [Vicinamibacteria bacterium]